MTNIETEQPWLSVTELLDRLAGAGFRISWATLYRYMDVGLPSHQPMPGGRRVFKYDEVDAWLKSRCFDNAAAQSGAK